MITHGQPLDQWRDAFVIQARHDGVPVSRVGEALAEIDAYCADSGQSPAEAFGDPRAYAEALAREVPAPEKIRRRRTTGWRAAGTLVAVLCLFEALDTAASGGHNGTITVGAVMTALAVAAGITALVTVRRWQQQGLGPMVAVAVVLAGLLFVAATLRGPSLFVESFWGLLAVAGFLFALVWWPYSWSRLRSGWTVDSRDRTEPPRPARLRTAAARWSVPSALFLLALVVVLLPRESLPG